MPDRLQSTAVRTARWAHAHHRSIAATLLLGLAGFGVTAFGIAPLAPDAAELPRRLINEPVAVEALDTQLEALADLSLQLRRGEITRASDSADSLLRRLGVADPAAVQWLNSDPVARRLIEGRPGKLVQATVDRHGRLQSLVARFPAEDGGQLSSSHFQRLSLSLVNGAWHGTLERVALATGSRLASGTIRSSLFAATDEAGIPDAVAVQMAEIFGTEIDFHRELRKGDRFSVVYETLTADGEPVTWNQGSGRVLAAEFVNQGQSHQAVWFGEGKGGYFDFTGQSKRRAFLASPLEFSRVTSGFSMRFHPILQKWRAHLGVDYGAPTGTPVRTVGEGVVEFAGQQNGYGNVVKVSHAGERSTLYAHLSRVDVKKGQRVEQGQRIGTVGATGWATGPHLHFELQVKGQHRDPLEIAKSSETVALDAAQRPRFAQVAERLRASLDTADTVVGQPGRFE